MVHTAAGIVRPFTVFCCSGRDHAPALHRCRRHLNLNCTIIISCWPFTLFCILTSQLSHSQKHNKKILYNTQIGRYNYQNPILSVMVTIITTSTPKPVDDPSGCCDHSSQLSGARRRDRPARVPNLRRRWWRVGRGVLPVLLVTAAFGRESHAFSRKIPTPPTPAASKRRPLERQQLPSCVGHVSSTIAVAVPPSHKNEKDEEEQEKETRTKVVNYYVIGTSHFRCQSSQDVTELLRPNHNNTDRQNNTNFRADGCVIELDPERTVRLTLDDAMVAAASLPTPRTTTATTTQNYVII